MLDANAQTPPAASFLKSAPAGGSAFQVAPNDPSINAASVNFRGGDADLKGYLTKPARDGMFPIVLGLSRGARIDAPHRGRHPPRRQSGLRRLGDRSAFPRRRHRQERFRDDPGVARQSTAGAPYQGFPGRARRREGAALCTPRSGRHDRLLLRRWRDLAVAAGIPELRAAVPFYGPPLPVDEVPRLKAAVLAIYAGKDERVNADIPAIESAMQKNGKVFRKIIYPDVDHAFHNDTGDRFNAATAKAAWDEALAWFGKYLQA
jgi:carboxymethylenebutenolidase